jgi:hypothetical protein
MDDFPKEIRDRSRRHDIVDSAWEGRENHSAPALLKIGFFECLRGFIVYYAIHVLIIYTMNIEKQENNEEFVYIFFV